MAPSLRETSRKGFVVIGKISLYLTKQYAMKAYKGVDV
jgi:hypothetical protein